MFEATPTAYMATGERCPGDLDARFTAPPHLQEVWSAGDDVLRARLRARHDAAVAIVVATGIETGLIPSDTDILPSRFALESYLDLPTLDAKDEVAIRNAADEIGAAYLAALRV
jgi:hypothetical protein